MTSLNIVYHALENAESQILEISQLSFDKIASLVEREEMEEAKKAIEPAIKEGTLDIRLIAYYFCLHFLDFGVVSLQQTLPLFVTLLSKYEKVLTPMNRKSKQIENSLTWFLSDLVSRIQLGERIRKQGRETPSGGN